MILSTCMLQSHCDTFTLRHWCNLAIIYSARQFIIISVNVFLIKRLSVCFHAHTVNTLADQCSKCAVVCCCCSFSTSRQTLMWIPDSFFSRLVQLTGLSWSHVYKCFSHLIFTCSTHGKTHECFPGCNSALCGNYTRLDRAVLWEVFGCVKQSMCYKLILQY